MFFKMTQKSPNIWVTSVGEFATKIFRKSSNLVTLVEKDVFTHSLSKPFFIVIGKHLHWNQLKSSMMSLGQGVKF